jgi:hypothetical protein
MHLNDLIKVYLENKNIQRFFLLIHTIYYGFNMR